MTIRAIAFDLDGTLCHTLPDLVAAANASRAHMGLPPLPDATIESYIGDGIPRLVHRVLTNSRAARRTRRSLSLFHRLLS